MTDRYLIDVRGELLLQRTLDQAGAWAADHRYVVIGDGADRILDAVNFSDWVVIIDPEWSEGEASSLRAGLDTVIRDQACDRAVVAHGDQVLVDDGIVAKLLDTQSAASAAAVVPQYRYARGWPIVVDASVWPRLMGLEGSVELLDVLASHPDGVEEVHFEVLAPPRLTSLEALEDMQRG